MFMINKIFLPDGKYLAERQALLPCGKKIEIKEYCGKKINFLGKRI